MRDDIPQLVEIRASVAENLLTTIITHERIVEALELRGKGWIAEHEERAVGFTIADKMESMIWALFLRPEWEGKGLGKMLLHRAVSWLWHEGAQRIWLSTEPNTRAAGFYTYLGWSYAGMTDNGEMRFEIKRKR